jgi:hypothetical protein
VHAAVGIPPRRDGYLAGAVDGTSARKKKPAEQARRLARRAVTLAGQASGYPISSKLAISAK